MKYLLLATLLFTSSAAMAYDDDPTHPFDASSVAEETVKISWLRVPEQDLLQACNVMYTKFGVPNINYAVNGCSVWKNDSCIIITATSTTMHTLGHESRHCFQRDWHE